MNKVILMTVGILGSILTSFGDELPIKYWPMNKDTHQYVGFKVDRNGSAIEVVNCTNVVTQIKKQNTNVGAMSYTKDELVKMFSVLADEPEFPEYMNQHFEFWYADTSKGMFILYSKKWTELK